MPIPTDQEAETTREVLALASFADAAARIALLADIQWAAQQEDNDLWAANRDTVDDVKRVGDIEFFDRSDTEGSILSAIRIRSRIRFGLSETANAGNAFTSTLQWF